MACEIVLWYCMEWKSIVFVKNLDVVITVCVWNVTAGCFQVASWNLPANTQWLIIGDARFCQHIQVWLCKWFIDDRIIIWTGSSARLSEFWHSLGLWPLLMKTSAWTGVYTALGFYLPKFNFDVMSLLFYCTLVGWWAPLPVLMVTDGAVLCSSQKTQDTINWFTWNNPRCFCEILPTVYICFAWFGFKCSNIAILNHIGSLHLYISTPWQVALTTI